MSELIDAKLIVTKSKKGYAIQIEIDGKPLPFSKLKLNDDKYNGKECKIERINGQVTKIIVDDKTIFPEQTAIKQSNQAKHTQNRQNQPRPQVDQSPSQTSNRNEEDMRDSYKPENIKYIPSDTKSSIQALPDIDNFALKLNKAARFDDIEQKFKFFHRQTKQNPTPSYCIDPKDFGQFDFKQLNTKMTTIKISLETQGYNITEPISKKPDWRLIVGLGNESVYETSMTLHHIYGIPYIPGSAVKGVVRNHIITECFNKNDKEEFDLKEAEKRALANKAFISLFGDQEHQGNIIFFDAFPSPTNEKPLTIKPDIINCHYDKYYEGKAPPADYHNPNPVFFLTVEGTPFNFFIGIKESKNTFNNITEDEINTIIPENYNKDKIPLCLAEEWLKKALKDHGIGAKTAVGYGYFGG